MKKETNLLDADLLHREAASRSGGHFWAARRSDEPLADCKNTKYND